MGKASRRKKLRRERLAQARGSSVSSRGVKCASRAEEFGRSTGSGLLDYEAVARRGTKWLAAALISRHNQRMERVGLIHPTLRARSRLIVNQLFGLDLGLRRLNIDLNRPPVQHGGAWVDHLAWGIDSAISAIRLLSSGQLAGAGQIARSQLERWAMNLAYNAQLARRQGETTSIFYDRVWAALDLEGIRILPEVERPRVGRRTSITGRTIEPGLLYGQVSDFLHGRGAGAEAAVHEASGLLDPMHLERHLEVGHQILDMLELCVEVIRSCVTLALMNSGYDQQRAAKVYAMSRLKEPAGNRPFPRWSLWPLVPDTGLSPTVVSSLRQGRDTIDRMHQGKRPAGRLYRDDEISELFFLDRRSRSADLALQAFEEETALLGAPIDFRGLAGRQTQLILTAEILGLIAVWNTAQPAVTYSAAMASSALRSAFWLWLEDDDRAMGVLRIVLESLARLRTWTRNPDKAAKIEKRNTTAPRDWLDAAGWRRLQSLNLALGELAHTRSNSRWGGARALLIQLQPLDENSERSPQRGRGFTLDAVTSLGARVALEAVAPLSADLQTSLSTLMSEIGALDETVNRRLEEWLARNWEQRSFDLGESGFVGPAQDA